MERRGFGEDEEDAIVGEGVVAEFGDRGGAKSEEMEGKGRGIEGFEDFGGFGGG